MAHKKIERKKELDRRRKRRAERIKARIHEASGCCQEQQNVWRSFLCRSPAKQRMRPGASAGFSLSEFREIVEFSVVFVSKGRLERSWNAPWWSESMPIYEYRCRKCGNVFEEWVKTFDSPELAPAPNAAAMNGSFQYVFFKPA